MKKEVFRQLMIGISLVWGIIVLPVAAFASDTDTLADQHFEKANTLLKQEKYEAAIGEYEKIVKLVTRSEIAQDAQYWIGQSYFRMGEFDKALSIFEKLIENYQESAIVPVTRQMISRVQQEKNNLRAKNRTLSNKSVIIDSQTGLKYLKIFSGENLTLLNPTTNIELKFSPDGRFMFDHQEHWVIPLQGEAEPFRFAPEMLDETIYGAWSPDMTKFAFISALTGKLFVIPVSPETGQATGTARKLIEGLRDETVRGASPPSWSPDGKRLAFIWWKNQDFDIWTISATGEELKQITNGPRWERRPMWTPDGKSIIFGRRRRKEWIFDVWRVPVEVPTPAPPKEGNAEKILDNAFVRGLSSDGKFLAFHQDGVRGVGIMRLSDKQQFTLVPPEEIWDGTLYRPIYAWSPQENKLLFYNSGVEFRATLGLVPVYGGALMALAEGVRLSPWSQGWSPDGKYIVTLGWGTGNLWIVPTDGGTPMKLELETEPKIWKYAFLPFSPDLKRLAFFTEDWSLWVVPISIEEKRTTGKTVKLAEEISLKSRYSVGWSPDSRRIAFSSTKSGNADIWVASVDGGKPKRLTNAPEDETVSGWSHLAAWSPDGKIIAYNKGKTIWVVSASGGKPKEIVRNTFEPVWSPDGKEIACIKRDYSFISIVTLATGEVRNVVNLKELGVIEGDDSSVSWGWGLTWSPDGRRLSFITVTEKDDYLWIVDAAGGEPIELAGDDTGKWFQYWSPDGKRLSYNSDRDVRVHRGTIWEVDVAGFLNNAE